MAAAVNWWNTYAPFGETSGEEQTWYTSNEGTTWTGNSLRYGLGFAIYDNFSPPSGRPTTKRLIGIADDALWYEDV
jgi:hypothetical protein